MEDKERLKNGAPHFILVGLFAIGIFFLGNTENTGQFLQNDVGKIMHSCQALYNKETCYAKAFGNLTKTTNRDYAFEVLRELQKIDSEARGCHFIAHAISTAEVEKSPSEWRGLLNTAPPDCSYGGVHGVLEAHAATAYPDGKLPKEIIPSLCNNPDTNNCAHGLGHLILVETNNDIEEALGICDTLPHDSYGKFECITGVFMERITAFNLEAHGLAGKEALNWPARVPELEELCREQSAGTPESVACWKEIVHAALVKFHNDPQMIVDFCETAPGEEETSQCIDHSLGIMAAGYNFNLDKMTPICEVRINETDFKNRCYAHLVGATLSTVPQEIPAAINFCWSLSATYQQECFTMIGNSLQWIDEGHRTLLARECARAPEEMRRRCESGGNSTIKFYTGN